MRNYGYNSFLVIWHNLGRLRAVLESKVLLFTVTHDESLTDPAHETSKNNPNVNSQQPLKIGHTLDIYLETKKLFYVQIFILLVSLIWTVIFHLINIFYFFMVSVFLQLLRHVVSFLFQMSTKWPILYIAPGNYKLVLNYKMCHFWD